METRVRGSGRVVVSVGGRVRAGFAGVSAREDGDGECEDDGDRDHEQRAEVMVVGAKDDGWMLAWDCVAHGFLLWAPAVGWACGGKSDVGARIF
jgi:hypothetical protein